jgi:hypothetical protein
VFDFLKKLLSPQPPADPPTEKQLRYASKIGVVVTTTMTTQELSEAIADAERKSPSVVMQRETIKAKGREREFGKELVDEEREWNDFADDGGYMLAVYSYRKEIVVNVLLVNEAFIERRGKLKLNVAAPKATKDRYLGRYLDWDRHFELPVDSLLYHDRVDPGFYARGAEGYEPGNRAYKALVDKGLRIARSL